MIEPTSTADKPTKTGSNRGPIGWILDLFSNLWFGIFLAAALFMYCSIGSAVPAVRQLPWLEMTEFEWFHWWPFNVLVITFSLCMAVITVRRIPLRKINAGVWMIHTGIIVLTIGSYYYFATKVEGDAPVFRRQVRVLLPGMEKPASFVAVPGSAAEVVHDGEIWQFEVQSTNTAWPILSDEHKGETAYAVNVMVHPPSGEPFVRQILDGYPQYTEDVMPGKGRAIKNIGRKLVAEQLQLTLGYHPTTTFQVMDTWALFVRKLGEMEWQQRPIEGLPRYNDHIGSRDQVFTDPHDRLPVRAIDLEVPPARDDDPLADAGVHVTGYLRYAQMRRLWRDGGSTLNPVLTISTLTDDGQSQQHELVAFDPSRNTGAEGAIRFDWVEDEAALAALPRGAASMLHMRIPATGKTHDIRLTDRTVAGPDGAFTPIEGTDLSFRIRALQNDLSLPNGRGQFSVALVDVKTPEGEFTRWVADNPAMTRDVHHGDGASADPHAADVRGPDPRLHFEYTPAGPPVIIAAHPGGLQFIFNGEDSRLIDRPVQVGETIQVVKGVSVRIDGMWRNARSEVKPYVVPRESRQRNAKVAFSMIRLEVSTSSGTQTKWLPFNQYAMPTNQYVYGGRFEYQPEVFRLPNGEQVEVLFSRRRVPLPNPIALDSFELDTHFGGYSGSVSTIRNYVSRLRFYQDGHWTDKAEAIAVNSPTEYAGYWYFQSMWDKPPRSSASAGMNYTGLGIGNRHGVYVQLAGCCLSVIGMIFAFYIKPVLVRRRAEAARAKAFGKQRREDTAATPQAVSEPVEV